MIKLWMAGWLRKLAQRLDGDLYLPVSPRLKAAAEDLLREQKRPGVRPEQLDMQIAEDLWLYGNAYTLNGKRVPPEDVVVHQSPTGCKPACNCKTALDFSTPLTGAKVVHLPLCPLYERPPRPTPRLPDPFKRPE